MAKEPWESKRACWDQRTHINLKCHSLLKVLHKRDQAGGLFWCSHCPSPTYSWASSNCLTGGNSSEPCPKVWPLPCMDFTGPVAEEVEGKTEVLKTEGLKGLVRDDGWGLSNLHWATCFLTIFSCMSHSVLDTVHSQCISVKCILWSRAQG